MARLAPVIKQVFFDNDGDPLVGGKIWTYLAGTTTPRATYIDENESAQNSNPVILDSAGRASICLKESIAYDIVVMDADDVVLYTQTNVQVADYVADDPDSGSAGEWVTHLQNQNTAATDLTGETVNSATFKTAIYDFIIQRGTTVFSSGRFALHYRDLAWRFVSYSENADDAAAETGVTFSLTGTTTAQLQAAIDNGAGNATIKLKRELVG